MSDVTHFLSVLGVNGWLDDTLKSKLNFNSQYEPRVVLRREFVPRHPLQAGRYVRNSIAVLVFILVGDIVSQFMDERHHFGTKVSIVS